MDGQTDDLAKRLFNLKESVDLFRVKMHGVKLDEVLSEWDDVIIHLKSPPEPSFKLALFIDQIETCPKLKTKVRKS
eukprot:12221826-Heterocapsa_arctica.AAC.1